MRKSKDREARKLGTVCLIVIKEQFNREIKTLPKPISQIKNKKWKDKVVNTVFYSRHASSLDGSEAVPSCGPEGEFNVGCLFFSFFFSMIFLFQWSAKIFQVAKNNNNMTQYIHLLGEKTEIKLHSSTTKSLFPPSPPCIHNKRTM